jgi:hypothetical protein
VERSFIHDFSWPGRRMLGLVHLPNGGVKFAFDRAADPKPIDWIDICRRASADADQRRARARAEWKKRRRRAAAEADRTALSEAQFRAKLSEANRAKLGEAVDAYMAREPGLRAEDVITPLMLLSSEKATETFAYLDLPTDETLILIDDCVRARRLYAGKHQAHAERLRATPDPGKMWTRLAELATYIGGSDEHDRDAIRRMSVALGARIRRHKYEQQSTSRRADKEAGRSEAIGRLKSSVLRLSGKANVKSVAILCSAVLGAEISEAAVKRARTQEELLDRRGIPLGLSFAQD